MSPSSIAGQFDFRYWCYSGDCSLLTEKHKGVFMVLVNGDMVPPIGSAQGPAKSGSYPPWLLGQPTPIGEGLTAPFSLGFIPGGHGSPVDGRTSVTVEDETLLRSYSDCTKIVNVHLCIDAAYAKEACGAKAQDAINKTVEGMERAVRRYWSVFCPCEEPDTYGPGGCRRRVLIIWHKKCGDAGGGVMPVPLKVRCGSVPGQPTGLTTPDREMDIEAPKGIAAWMDEVYAHEIGHNLLGVPPPGGAINGMIKVTILTTRRSPTPTRGRSILSWLRGPVRGVGESVRRRHVYWLLLQEDATRSSAADLFSVLRIPLCSMEKSRLQIRISEGIDVKPGRGTLKARWITRKGVL